MDILEELSVITQLPITMLEDLWKGMECCVLGILLDDIETGKEISTINLGFGNLYVKIGEDALHYKFVPSSEFECELSKGIKTQTNPLIWKTTTRLTKKLMNTYKKLV